MIQDQLDGAAGRPGIKGCELDERRRIGRGSSRRPWLVQQAAVAQHASPGKEAGFADLVALTKLTDGGLRLLPATDEFEPATLFGSIRMLGHGAPPWAPILATASRCVHRTDTDYLGRTPRNQTHRRRAAWYSAALASPHLQRKGDSPATRGRGSRAFGVVLREGL